MPSNFSPRTLRKNRVATAKKQSEKIKSDRRSKKIFFSPRTSRKNMKNPLTRKNRVATAKKQSEKIKSDRKSRLSKRQSQFLSYACGDSSECLMLGKYRTTTLQYFDNFKNLEYADTYQIINAGGNGVVLRLNFLKNKYNSYGILKVATPIDNLSPNKPINLQKQYLLIFNPDNSIYEYLVGLHLNNLLDYLPNFLETYQLLRIDNYETYNDFIQKINSTQNLEYKVDDKLIRSFLQVTPTISFTDKIGLSDLIHDGCITNAFGIKGLKKSYTYVLMTQYMKNPITLKTKIKSNGFNHHELIYVLFQIYYTLFMLYGSFAHYDLHVENVMLYQPYPDGYIKYFYHIKNENNEEEVIHFRSKYIVKLIDYGRSYFEHTKMIKDMISQKRNPCFGVKAESSGYNIKDGLLTYGINFDSVNVSYDLRLLDNINRKINIVGSTVKLDTTISNASVISEILNKVVYGVGMHLSNEAYGTVPNPVKGYPQTINNIHDAFMALKDGVKQTRNTIIKPPGPRMVKKAEMHIYGLDKQYEFNEM